MGDVTTIGLDIAKSSFQAHGAIFEGADLWPQTVPPPPGMRTRPPRPPRCESG